MHLKISSAKWRPFCPGGDELTADVCSNDISTILQGTLLSATLKRKTTISTVFSRCEWVRRRKSIPYSLCLKRIDNGFAVNVHVIHLKLHLASSTSPLHYWCHITESNSSLPILLQWKTSTQLTHRPFGYVEVILNYSFSNFWRIDILSIPWLIALKWTPKDLFDDYSTLHQWFNKG